MFDIEIDNMFAVIVFIAAMAGIIGLTVYRMYKKNNGITLDAFLDEHYEHIIGVLQDVVSILLVNIEDYPDKETYEKDIIRLTIEKLDDNCNDFGIDTGMMKLINKDALADGIHKILTTENVTVFTSTVPKQVMEDNKELYDEKVLEVAEVLEVVNDEIKTNNEAVEKEPTEEQKEISNALDEILNKTENEVEDGIKIEPTEEDKEITTDTEKVLPPREAYYGEKKEKIEFSEEDIAGAVLEIYDEDTFSAKCVMDKVNDIVEDVVESEDFNNFVNNPVPIIETAEQLADLAKIPSADVDSAVSSIKSFLNREHVDHE